MAQKQNAPLPPAPAKTRIYTVPSHQSFARALADGILQKTGGDPLKLADYTILVPNGETKKQLQQAFLAAFDGKPGIVPDIEIPGNIESENLGLTIFGDKALSQQLMNVPPAVPELLRQLILAGEILKIPGIASSVQKALQLASELGRFIDELQRHDIDLKNITNLVPAEFQGQWTHTAEFLKLITEIWPSHLAGMGMVDPEARKNALLAIQVKYWSERPPQKPYIAAGFADTTPATMELLKTVSLMPEGTLVLQGLDLQLDEKSWQVLTEVHPQFSNRKMLKALGVPRALVAPWDAPERSLPHTRATDPQATNAERVKLLRETTRPAGTSDGWSHLKTRKKGANDNGAIDVQALSGMDLMIASTPQEEASAIALKMRETLEVPGRSAVFVTADRSLARRVSARLRYWNIHVEDSAGLSLADTSVGIFLSSLARMASEDWAPVALLEALKHPLSALGESKAKFREKVIKLEDMALHGPRPAPGAPGIKGALTSIFNRIARRPNPGKTPEQLEQERQEMQDWVSRLELAGKPFFDKMTSKTPVPFKDLLDEHIRFAENMARDDKKIGAKNLWRNRDGMEAARFLSDLRTFADLLPAMTGKDYADVIYGMINNVTLKPAAPSHPLLKIVTPEQARLLKADVVIAGGLNDGVWPKAVKENPWFSPKMMQTLGLPAPEEKIGREVHQFIQVISNPDVLLSRSLRTDNVPAVASPLLTRLMTVLKGAGLEKAISGKNLLLDIHRAMHTPSKITPVEPPAPKPAVKDRPKTLPVTAIENLMTDPYSIYAKYILKVKPRQPLDASPTVNQRGDITHEALAYFIERYPDQLPDNALEELLKIGESVFRRKLHNPTLHAFWWPRFERVAEWFVKFEKDRRGVSKALGVEVGGKLDIDIDGEVFTLTAVADRIDRSVDDKLTIIDYKTGAIPSQTAIEKGTSPQLTLEALIACTGGFDGVDAGNVGKMEYWKLSGRKPAGTISSIKGDVTALIKDAHKGVKDLLKAFNDEQTPYLSTPNPDEMLHDSNYDHLSRVGEWSKVRKSTTRKTGKQTTARHVSAGKRRRGR